jgi:lysophospholipase L1-like esterase
LPLFALVLLGAACGGTTGAPPGGGAPGGSDASASQGGDDAGSGTQPDGGDDASVVNPPPPPPPTSAAFGTYIALGDSISDRGGQGPFFYDLLLKNDATTYPAWAGHDLSTRFPGIQYVHGAVAGSITGPYGDVLTSGAPLMTTQVQGLGHSYPGDVLVTITIGGNDLNFHAGDAVTGLDAPDKQKFTANLKTLLDELTTPGRLGAGKVIIVEANIYDASDGQGNWQTGGGAACPPYNVPGSQDVGVFAAWNQIISNGIGATGGIDRLLDLHALFAGHGFNGQDSWYFTDCIHPSQKGHHQLRREAWRLITGETPAP